VHKEFREPQELKVHKVLRGHGVHKVLQEPQELKVLKVLKVPKVL
jgi:hypothetical protein